MLCILIFVYYQESNLLGMAPIKSYFSKMTENNNTLLGNLHEEKDEEKYMIIECPEMRTIFLFELPLMVMED